MKKQSKKHSVYESIANVVIGLLISIITQMILYPLMGIPVSFNQNLIITGVFFVISFIRGYLIRRFFNRL
jgi:high-affinity Fe2+/Pb2+ permease